MVNRASSTFNALMGLILIASPFLQDYAGISRLVMIAVGVTVIGVALAARVIPEVKLPDGMIVATKTANVAVGALLVAGPYLIEPFTHYAAAALGTGIFTAIMIMTTSGVPSEIFNNDLQGAVTDAYSHLDHEAPAAPKHAVAA